MTVSSHFLGRSVVPPADIAPADAAQAREEEELHDQRRKAQPGQTGELYGD
jgi:hypothetical protein